MRERGEASTLRLRCVSGQERLTLSTSVASTRGNDLCQEVRQRLIQLFVDRQRRLHVRDKQGVWKPRPRGPGYKRYLLKLLRGFWSKSFVEDEERLIEFVAWKVAVEGARWVDGICKDMSKPTG